MSGSGCSSFAKLLHLGELGIGFLFAARRTQQPAKTVMCVWLRRIDADRLPKMTLGSSGVVPACQQDAEIQMREPDIRIQLQRPPQMFRGFFFVSRMHFCVAQICQGLRVLRLIRQFRLELAAGVFVPLLLPIEVSKTEVNLRLARRGFHRSFKLRRRLVFLVCRIEHFAQQHVNGRGIRILGQQKPELIDRALVLF